MYIICRLGGEGGDGEVQCHKYWRNDVLQLFVAEHRYPASNTKYNKIRKGDTRLKCCYDTSKFLALAFHYFMKLNFSSS